MKQLALSLSIVLLFAAHAFAAAAFPTISLEDLQKAIASKSVTLLDATGPEHYAKAHIPGAIDYFADESHLAKNLPADKGALIVAYCYNPACPAYSYAAEAVRKLGYTNVKHFAPGIEGWIEAKQPMAK